MRRGGRVAALAVLGLGLAGGCTSTDEQPEPAPTVSASPARVPAGKWSGLSAECPSLTGPAARSLDRSGPGQARKDTPLSDNIVTRYCDWPGPDKALSVHVNVQICRYRGEPCQSAEARMDDERERAEKRHDEWRRGQLGSVYEPDATVPGLDDAMVLSTIPNRQVVVIGRTDNAIVAVYLNLPSAVAEVARELEKYKDRLDLLAQEQLTANREHLLGLVADVLDDMR